jgi:hypothetical protein
MLQTSRLEMNLMAPQLQARATYIDGAHYFRPIRVLLTVMRGRKNRGWMIILIEIRLSRLLDLESGKRNKLDRLAVEKVQKQSR